MSDESLSILDADEQPGQRRRSRRGLIITLSILLAILLGIVGIVVYYVSSANNALNNMVRDPNILAPERSNRPEPVPTKEGSEHAPVNIVLMGSDSRGEDRGRSDVLQLLHIPGERDAAYLLSLPRDSWVEIPGRGEGKINWAYSFGGPSLTVETLENLLQVPMDHTVIIDFDGFMNVIDTLGGVTVVNKHASGSNGFTFPEGEITLSGDEALTFVRERYNLPSGDFDRAERQRDVIQAIVKKLASAGVLANPVKFNEVVSTLAPQFTVDEGFTNDVIIDLARESTAAVTNVHSLGLPNLGPGWAGDQSIIQVDWDAIDKLRDALRNDDLESFFYAYGG